MEKTYQGLYHRIPSVTAVYRNGRRHISRETSMMQKTCVMA